jgi:hypothetical protein
VLHNAGAALSVALLTMLNCRLAGQQAGSGEPARVMAHPA